MTAKKAASKNGNKETVYIDVDDEITTIIDKVRSSDHKIIALVLPKRANVLQSVVNMKLLKKAAVNDKKNLVLITSEMGLLPLAGAAGLHVAKSLQSKPEIPPLPRGMESNDEPEIVGVDADDAIDTTASIGALADRTQDSDEPETIELDNVKMDELPSEVKNAHKPKKNRALKVPNFERFRLGIVLAALGLVLLIAGWFVAFVIMPKATITLKTDTTSVVSSFDFTASTTQPELDVNDKKIPAILKETKKTDSAKIPATGERDDGTRASGTVTLSVPCASGDSTVVPAGTAVSTAGSNYITQSSAAINNHASSPCRFTRDVGVIAAQNGEAYNIEDGKTFTVAGYAGVTGRNDDDIDGGTSKIVKIVSQKDIDDAQAQIAQRQGTTASDELKALIETENQFALTETLVTGEPKNTVTPELGKEAAEVTVTSEITYTMLGVKKDELAKIIENDVSDEVDLEKQSISDDGIDTAIMRINNNATPGQAFISFRTSVTAGPEIDENALREAARGKKRGEIEDYAEALPGVEEVTIEYSPFWVFSTPKAGKKITVVVEKTSVDTEEDSNSSNE